MLDESHFDLAFALAVDAELFRLDAVVRWLDAADGRLDAGVLQALRVFDRDILGGFNRSSQRSHWRR